MNKLYPDYVICEDSIKEKAEKMSNEELENEIESIRERESKINKNRRYIMPGPQRELLDMEEDRRLGEAYNQWNTLYKREKMYFGILNERRKDS